jgi:hypothetical protein
MDSLNTCPPLQASQAPAIAAGTGADETAKKSAALAEALKKAAERRAQANTVERQATQQFLGDAIYSKKQIFVMDKQIDAVSLYIERKYFQSALVYIKMVDHEGLFSLFAHQNCDNLFNCLINLTPTEMDAFDNNQRHIIIQACLKAQDQNSPNYNAAFAQKAKKVYSLCAGG